MLQVEIAQTPEQQRIGLSHRTKLAEGHGMLFIFNTDDTHSIWMKDMHFPIDIIWIDNTMKVIHIEQNIAPDTYPHSFTPPTPARYVLEVPAGYTKERVAVREGNDCDWRYTPDRVKRFLIGITYGATSQPVVLLVRQEFVSVVCCIYLC